MIGLTVTVSSLTGGTVGFDYGFSRKLRRDQRIGGNQGCNIVLRLDEVVGIPIKGRGIGGALCTKTRTLVEEADTNVVVIPKSGG